MSFYQKIRDISLEKKKKKREKSFNWLNLRLDLNTTNCNLSTSFSCLLTEIDTDDALKTSWGVKMRMTKVYNKFGLRSTVALEFKVWNLLLPSFYIVWFFYFIFGRLKKKLLTIQITTIETVTSRSDSRLIIIYI